MKNKLKLFMNGMGEKFKAMGQSILQMGKRFSAWVRKLSITQKWLARAGYYAALSAILVILGIASYSYRNDHTVSPTDLQTAQPQAVVAVRTPAPTSQPTPAPTVEPTRYAWPVEGEIIAEYAPDELVWSETLSQWQIHPAIDIAAAAGEAVMACADGTVKDAYSDPLWGNVIIIEHADGMESMYANLNTLNLVAVGDPVTCGDAISAIGKSAACESDMPWHLHFALMQDGEAIDFEAYMRENQF